jgi:hypothetical protein
MKAIAVTLTALSLAAFAVSGEPKTLILGGFFVALKVGKAVIFYTLLKIGEDLNNEA